MKKVIDKGEKLWYTSSRKDWESEKFSDEKKNRQLFIVRMKQLSQFWFRAVAKSDSLSNSHDYINRPEGEGSWGRVVHTTHRAAKNGGFFIGKYVE